VGVEEVEEVEGVEDEIVEGLNLPAEGWGGEEVEVKFSGGKSLPIPVFSTSPFTLFNCSCML
jgi:hypothetical protein